MKEDDYTISLPYGDYKRLLKQKESFTDLKKQLSDCFDTSIGSIHQVIYYDEDKIVDIASEYLNPYFKNMIKERK